MYNEDYRRQKEIGGLYVILENHPDPRPTPAEVLENREKDWWAFAETQEERFFLETAYELFENVEETNRAFRGLLRRRLTDTGWSERRFYRVFRSLKKAFRVHITGTHAIGVGT